MSRSTHLSTVDLYRLDVACRSLWRFARDVGSGGVYLVGSSMRRPDFRDVDVRMILGDDEFDRLFADAALWEVFCYAVARQLAADTGLPIDFQVQRATEANANFPFPRNPLGHGHRNYAALGDATPYVNANQPTATPETT